MRLGGRGCQKTVKFVRSRLWMAPNLTLFSDCHKLIMILSDGGTENPSRILKVYTNSSREITANVRIFTYAVGPHPLPTVALKDMACATGGSFTSIISMGAIRTKVQVFKLCFWLKNSYIMLEVIKKRYQIAIKLKKLNNITVSNVLTGP